MLVFRQTDLETSGGHPPALPAQPLPPSWAGEVRPLLRACRESAARALGVSDPGGGEEGEILVAPGGQLLYYRLSEDGALEEIGSVGGGDGARDRFDRLRAHLLGAGALPASAQASPTRLEELTEEAASFPVSEQERAMAEILARPSARRLLQRIGSSPGLSIQEASDGRDPAEVGAEVQGLDEVGLLSREFEVFCHSTGQQVSRVPSLQALEEAAARGFKCFHCGRSISEERVVQLLSVSPRGERLARPDTWLALRVASSLIRAGVDPERILVTPDPAVTPARGRRGLELLAEFRGHVFFFQVQEERVTSGEAFRFLHRARFFQPDGAFLVTSTVAEPQVRRLLRPHRARAFLLEGLEALDRVLDRTLEHVSRRIAWRALSGFDRALDLPIGRWVAEHLLGPEGSTGPLPTLPAREAPVPGPVAAGSPPEGTPPVPALDEALEGLIEALTQAPLSGRAPALLARLTGLEAHGPVSALLADRDGLIVLGRLSTWPDPELAAAVQAGLLDGLAAELEATGAGAPSALVIETGQAGWRLLRAGEGMTLVVHGPPALGSGPLVHGDPPRPWPSPPDPGRLLERVRTALGPLGVDGRARVALIGARGGVTLTPAGEPAPGG